MRNLSPAMQRLVLAFTTGLFLACSAHVSVEDARQSPVESFATP